MDCFHPETEIPVALFMGGLDPSAGAGVLRDLVVASGLGVHPMAIPMAETVQNGFECDEIAPPTINPMKQLKSLNPHLRGKWGVKLSMFQSVALLQDVLPQINQLEPFAAIWDPVLAPTHGVGLHCSTSIKEVIGLLASKKWIVSPNIQEARILADMPHEPIETVAKKIMNFGIQSVWIRGGHSTGKTVQDLWCDNNGLNWLTPFDRLDGDPRGTGCTATSAWLAFRLTGMEPINAAESAIQYIRKAWKHLHMPGKAGRPTFPPRVQK